MSGLDWCTRCDGQGRVSPYIEEMGLGLSGYDPSGREQRRRLTHEGLEHQVGVRNRSRVRTLRAFAEMFDIRELAEIPDAPRQQWDVCPTCKGTGRLLRPDVVPFACLSPSVLPIAPPAAEDARAVIWRAWGRYS
jgi:hypothetical protein